MAYSQTEHTDLQVNTAFQRVSRELNRGDTGHITMTGVKQPDGRWTWKVKTVRHTPDPPQPKES